MQTFAFVRAAAGALLLAACASAPPPPDFAGLEAAVAAGAYPATTGVLVLRDGRSAYEHYFGAGAPGRLNDTRSATKTVVALAVGAALADGAIKSVDDAVWPLFATEGYAATPAARAITWRDLLTMTSSRDCDDNNDTPGNEENMYPQENWKAFFWSLPDREGWARAGDGLGPWRYCTAGSFILGQAVERAAGERIDDYVARRIFAPLGITRAAWDKSPSGEIQTGGGLELTLRDLGKLARLILDRGAYGGAQILPAAWIDEMTTARRDAFAGMRYGYQMWTRDYASPCGVRTAWFMAGNGGNHALVFPADRLVVVVTRERYNTRTMHPETFAMVETQILPALVCGEQG